QPGAAILFRPEALIGDRLVDEACDHIAPALAIGARLLRGHGDGEMWNAVEEVRGSVERIDDPARLRVIAGDLAGFLQQETPVGPCRPQLVVKGALGGVIRLGVEVSRALARNLKVLDLAGIAAEAL